ncbi:MAG: hypothetical protein QW596_04595 [Sulfolobales archaeon]
MRGVIAGLITGLFMCLTFILLKSMIEDLIYTILMHQLTQQVPPDKLEEILSNIKPTIHVILMIAPVAQVIQYIMLGAVFGLLQGFICVRFRLHEMKSAIVAGITYLLILSIMPLMIVSSLMPEIFESVGGVDKNFIYLISLFQGIVFLTSLIIVNYGKGFISKFINAKPVYT